MGIFSFSHAPVLSGLLLPVQAWTTWLLSVKRVSRQLFVTAEPRQAHDHPALPFASGITPARHCSANAKFGKTGSKPPYPSRLKVIREFDSAISPACAGRMAISGRMADVCAELERMVQRDAIAR